jgi:hypothetical protein
MVKFRQKMLKAKMKASPEQKKGLNLNPKG